MKINNMKYLLSFEKYKISKNIKVHDTEIYNFKTDDNEYTVKITPFQGKHGYFSIGFGVKTNISDYDTTKIVNENPFEVMDTICDIMLSFKTKMENKYKDFIEKFNIKESIIKGFIFSFTGDKEKNAQRFKLYKRTIEKRLPNATLLYENGIFYINI